MTSSKPNLSVILAHVVPAIVGVYRIACRLVKPILILSPIPVILYILSPVFVFCQVLLDVLVFAPVGMTMYILDVIHPLYVFVGVACITGCLLGLVARFVSEWLVKMAVEHEQDA